MIKKTILAYKFVLLSGWFLGEFLNSLKSVQKGLDVLAARHGKTSRCVGVKMHRIASEVLDTIEKCEFGRENGENKW